MVFRVQPLIAFGVGTIVHFEPFQCAARARNFVTPFVPTTQMSSAEITARPDNSVPRPCRGGLGRYRHLVPSQRTRPPPPRAHAVAARVSARCCTSLLYASGRRSALWPGWLGQYAGLDGSECQERGTECQLAPDDDGRAPTLGKSTKLGDPSARMYRSLGVITIFLGLLPPLMGCPGLPVASVIGVTVFPTLLTT